MKKNKMMRLASVLLVLCLLTTSVISGTFAKYVTSGDAEDVARVAKWGVVLTIDGDSSFSNEYKTEDTGKYNGAVSVQASDEANVVAPGTSSADVEDGVLTFSIAGTPEVATRVDIDFTATSDIFVKGTIPNYTVAGNVSGTGTQTYPEEALAAEYHPVAFTLKQTAPTAQVLVDKGTLADVQAFLADYSGATYAPNTNLAATFELSWAWSYGTYDILPDLKYTSNEGLAAANDIADTFLGNVAANASFATYTADGATSTTTVAAANYSTNLQYALEISVTQVD